MRSLLLKIEKILKYCEIFREYIFMIDSTIINTESYYYVAQQIFRYRKIINDEMMPDSDISFR